MLRLGGALGFEQWAAGEAEFLRLRFLDVTSRLLPDLIQAGAGDAAWRLAGRLRDADPNRQENWRTVLELGSVVLSPAELLAEMGRFEQHLDEAELRPEPATITMITKIRAGHSGEPRDRWGATIVGRSDVLSGVLTARREAESGAARWLHLAGLPGIGKTRVLAEAGAQLAAAGWLVATAKGGLGARELPHGLLEAIVTERPLALFVDDLHWADAASLDVLRLLGDRLPNRVLLLTAARPLCGGAPGSLARVVQLVPLSAAETGRLVEGLGTLPDEPWCNRFLVTLQQETGGNPLLVLETLRLADAERLLVREGHRWTTSDPEALVRRLVEGGVIESRFAAQTPLERTVLTALAVVGSALPIEAVAAAAESTTEQVRQALYRLERAGHVVPREPEGPEGSQGGAAASLRVSCLGGATRSLAIYLRAGGARFRDGELSYRVDGAEPVTEAWIESAVGISTTLLYAGGAFETTRFAGRLPDSGAIQFKYVTEAGATETPRFVLRATVASLAPVLAACPLRPGASSTKLPSGGSAPPADYRSSPVLVQSRIAPHGEPVLWNWGGSSLGPRYTSIPWSEPTR